MTTLPKSSDPTKVWRNGAWVSETDLMASGNPPPAPAAPAPALDDWTLDTGTPSAGIEVKFSKGKKYYRAVAMLDDDRYDGEKRAVSKEYRSCDEADAVKITGHHVNPGAMQHQNDISAAVARSHMKADQASPKDMQNILKELVSDLEYPYRLWQQKLERHVTRLRASVELRAVLDLMLLDIAEVGMVDEYKQFSEQLAMLLKGKVEPHDTREK